MLAKMFKWLGDGLQRWQAIYTAWRYLKPFLVPAGAAGLSRYYVTAEHFRELVILSAAWGFSGWWVARSELFAPKAPPPSPAGSRDMTPVRALERYYLALASLKEHVGHMLDGRRPLDALL